MKSAVDTFRYWVPLVVVGTDEKGGVVSIESATGKQVRAYRNELWRKIETLARTATALDELLALGADVEDEDAPLMKRIRERHPEEFFDE